MTLVPLHAGFADASTKTLAVPFGLTFTVTLVHVELPQEFSQRA